ncbi:MAG: patatin-like phospholipase family protein [Chloroflexi bacterium]|nr:patatin-like phospholipase family protein [Chloroflexota bacterium]
MPGTFNPQGKKVILSLSGGGMRGLISLALLTELERHSGRPIYEQVDLIAGTSTGALMAAGFAVGMSAERILTEIYRDALPRAFGRRGPFFWLRFLLRQGRYLYSLEPFVRILTPYVANLRVGDIEAPILLLTTTDARNGNTYYIVSRGPGRARFANWPLAGAVAASAAAPVFFPPVRGNLIDGGVGVHYNPCFSAAVEAMEYLGVAEGFEDGNVILIALGSGYTPALYGDGDARRFHLLDWAFYAYQIGFSQADQQQVSTTRRLYGQRLDFRYYNPLFTRESLQHNLGLSLQGRPDPRQIGLDSTERAALDLLEETGRAYARRIDWRRENIMPWQTRGGQPERDDALAPIHWEDSLFSG